MNVTTADRAWWRDAVVYQVYVRSFADSDGDGRGDLRGILERLDHLSSLGIDAIWLNPCYPSPQLDHGYDVSDYFDIEPTYGDLTTFDRLVAAARERSIKVLMDVVPNHCSDQHEWFQAALRAAPGSAERARFWFRDGRGEHGELPPNNWMSVFGGPAWSRITEPDGTPGQWYLRTFAAAQPDLNWENPEVHEHFERMLTFWFDRGVEGFRVDAVAVLGKHPGLPDAPPPPPGTAENDVFSHNPYSLFVESAHDHWRRWRHVIDEYERTHPGRQLVTVSEAYTPGKPELLLKFVEPDQFHQSFCFDLLLAPWHRDLIFRAVDDVHRVLGAAGASLTWTLNNHDAQRSVTRYGRADAHLPESWTGNNLVYTGAPVDLAVGTRRARAMIAFVAGLPGSLYLYQGEELGLPEVLDIPDDRREDPIFFQTEGREIGRDGCRVPMPWTDDASTAFGFSPVAAEPWLPQPIDWGRYAAAHQVDDPSSMLSLYREVMAGRRTLTHAAPLEWLPRTIDGVLGYVRGDVAVVLNVSQRQQSIEALGTPFTAVVIASDAAATTTSLPPDSAAWYRIARG
ncbi:MAG: glycoside hydrolase family 13 protein [Ilumatobacteraceae bacterium]